MAITARFQADFSSFIDAIDKAEVELADFGKGAETVQKRLNAMIDNFSGRKLIQEASLMTIAIEKAGGVAALTEKELERVGAKANEAAEKLKRLGIEVPPGLKNLADATKSVAVSSDQAGISFTKLVASLVTSQAIIAGVKAAWHAFTGEITSSITAANEAEKAHVQLVAALRAQGTATPSVIKAFGEYAAALQKTTIYQDDALEGAEALLVQVGNVMPRDMQKALVAVTNLASGLGIDLNTATLQVAKAAEGNTTALRKAGVVIDETRAKSEGFGYVLDEVNKKFGGQAEAIAATYQGRLQQLGNTWNNVEESIGRVITQNATILAVFDSINRALEENTRELNANIGANELVSDAVIAGVRAFSLSLTAIGYIQQAYAALRVASNEVAKAFINIGIAVLDSAHAIGTATKYINPVSWSQTWKTGMREVAESSEFLKGAVEGLNQDSVIAVSRADRWSASIAKLTTGADKLAGNLEATRGKTKALADVTTNAVGVWDRQTKAIADTSEARRKEAEVLKKAEQATADFNKRMHEEEGAAIAASTNINALTKNLQGLGAELPKLGLGMTAFSASSFEAWSGTAKGFERVNDIVGLMPDLTDLAKQHMRDLGDEAEKSLGRRLYDRLDDVDKILSQIPGKFAEIAVVAARTGKAILDNLGKGDVVGALVAGVVGGIQVITKLFRNAEKEINPIRQAFVDAAGGLDALNRHAHEAGTTLDQLLNAKNPEQYKAAIDALNKSFADLDARIKAVGDGLRQAAAGTNALADSLLAPLKAMHDALGKDDVTGDLAERMAKSLEDVQPAFEHLGQYVAATFAAQIHEGASAFDAFQSLAPAFADLQAGIEQFGLKSTATIDQLLKIQGVVGANKDVSDSVQALSDIYDGLTQAGYLTKDLFEAFAEDISHQFDLLVSRGADGTTALQLMQPELQKLWEGQQKFGAVTDESTAALLKQAEEQGLVGEDMKNVNDKILDVLISIADVFGAKLPASMQAMVDATKKAQADAQKALDAIHAPDINIGVHFNVDNLDLPQGSDLQVERMALGGQGHVTKPTLFLAGESGPEDYAFSGGGNSFNAGAGGGGDNAGILQQILEALERQPRAFRDAAMGAAV